MVKNLLIMLKNHLHIHLILLQKEQLKKKTEPMRNKITDRITKVSKT